MKTKYLKKKYKNITFFYLKKNEKYFNNLKKSINIIEVVDKKLYREVLKIKNILIVNTKKFDTALAYPHLKTVVITIHELKREIIWVSGALIHEAKHISQPKNKNEDYYWCEMNATKGEMQFFKALDDKYYLDWVDPKIGRKKYFETLKKRQKQDLKNNSDSKNNVFIQYEGEAQKDLKKINSLLEKLIKK